MSGGAGINKQKTEGVKVRATTIIITQSWSQKAEESRADIN